MTEAGVEEVKVLLPGSGEVNQPPGNIFIYHDVFMIGLSVYNVKACFCFRFGMMSSLQRCIKEAGL